MHTYIHTYIQSNSQTARQPDSQPDIQTHRHTDTQTDTNAYMLMLDSMWIEKNICFVSESKNERVRLTFALGFTLLSCGVNARRNQTAVWLVRPVIIKMEIRLAMAFAAPVRHATLQDTVFSAFCALLGWVHDKRQLWLRRRGEQL